MLRSTISYRYPQANSRVRASPRITHFRLTMDHGRRKRYQEYLKREIALFEAEKEVRDSLFTDQIPNLVIRSVLDVGCGAGQELWPFADKYKAFCVGMDLEPGAADIFTYSMSKIDDGHRIAFVCGNGETIPFRNEAFDLIICRVAIPYMNVERAITEMSRVLASSGRLILTTHRPSFYVQMLRHRLVSEQLRRSLYPIVCIFGSCWYWATGKQARGSFWKGREVFLTKRMLRKELEKVNLRIDCEFHDGNDQSDSFVISRSL